MGGSPSDVLVSDLRLERLCPGAQSDDGLDDKHGFDGGKHTGSACEEGAP